MVRIWQDFDDNNRLTWGHWFGTRSLDGHIVEIVGPFESQAKCLAALGEVDILRDIHVIKPR